MRNDRSMLHIKPWSRDYSHVCGCLLHRFGSRRVVYFPCEAHFGLPYELEERDDGGASLFMERGLFMDGLRRRGLLGGGS